MSTDLSKSDQVTMKEFSMCTGVENGSALEWLWSNRDLFSIKKNKETYEANIPSLIDRAESLEGHLSILRLLRKRKSQGTKGEIKHINQIYSFLKKEKAGIEKTSAIENEIKEVSFITNNLLRNGVHARVAILHILSIACHKKIKKVTIIYLDEANLPARPNVRKNIENNIYSSISKFLSNTPNDCHSYKKDEILSKISIIFPERKRDLDSHLSGIVFRFQGASPFPSHNLFLEEIFTHRFVATITFSSQVKDSEFTDIILSRNRHVLKKKEVPYPFPNTHREMVKEPSHEYYRRQNIMVSVYGGERISQFFSEKNRHHIEHVDNFLCESLIEQWILVGARDISTAQDAAEQVLSKNAYSKISIAGRSDLHKLYSEAKVFFSLPGVFGGGGGASEAVANGVPILLSIDRDSDISNSFSDSIQFPDTRKALNFLSESFSNQENLYDLLCKQQDEMREKFDLKASGEKIYEILESSIKSGNFDHKFRAAENT